MENEDEKFAHVEALRAAYPRLFAKGTTIEVWFPRGWTSIVNALCSFLDVLLDDAQAAQFRVEQVKEKFGTLRFYYSVGGEAAVTADIHLPKGVLRLRTQPTYPQPFPADAVDAAIAQAEKLTACTCATCGAPGKLRTKGWHHVACDECEAKRTRRQAV